MSKIESHEECKRRCDDLARAKVTRDELQAQLDAELLAVREKFAHLHKLEGEIDDQTKALSAYLRSAKGKQMFPAGKSSAESTLAEFGINIGERVTKLSKDWDDERQIRALIVRGHNELVITTRKPDKDGIKKLSTGEQAECGFRTAETTTFWLKPKTAAKTRVADDAKVKRAPVAV